MSYIDDIDAGDYIAISGIRNPKIRKDPWSGQDVEEYFDPDGLPLRVLGISLPWVAFETPTGNIGSVDSRRFYLQKLTKEYGEMMFDLIPQKPQQIISSGSSDEYSKRGRRKPKRGKRIRKRAPEGFCNSCGDKMIQILKYDDQNKPCWKFFCRNCGRDGGEAPPGAFFSGAPK